MRTTGRTPGWAHNTNIYEVNLRQYTSEGTFDAFSRELPRLKDMGVQTLWLMPVTPIAQKNRKGIMGSPYACSDYTSINAEFGTLEDFKRLVGEAHELGFKLIIDWVANHTGWDHVWTINHPDYYLKDPNSGDFKMASGMEDIIELDYNNPSLRMAMIEAMQFWVKECDIDGFRCDLASWVQLDFWQEARPKVDALKELFWLGEFDELESQGYGNVFDASYTWKWMHTTRDYYQQRLPLVTLESLLKEYSALGDESMRAWFTTNHDENSWNGTEYDKYGDMATALAVFSATWNGIPLLYSGQEMPNLKRLAFFEKDPIQWNNHYELHEFYKTLLNLSASHPALRSGDAGVSTRLINANTDSAVLVYLRKNGEDEILVLLNLSDDSPNFKIDADQLKGEYCSIFSTETRDFDKHNDFIMQPWQYLVYVRNSGS